MWNAWGSDGELTVEQAAAVTNLATKFKQNSVITSLMNSNTLQTHNLTIATVLLVYIMGLFAGCVNLESVTLMPNITQLEGSAFSGCTSLKSIALPDTIK